MKRQGRPSVFTRLTLKKLEEVFSLGGTDQEACLYADISPASLYNYQKLHPEFISRKEILKSSCILKARKCVVDALSKDPDLAFKFLSKYLDQEHLASSVVSNSPIRPYPKSDSIRNQNDNFKYEEYGSYAFNKSLKLTLPPLELKLKPIDLTLPELDLDLH